MAGAIVPSLGELVTVAVPAEWPYARLWRSPIGKRLSATFFDDNTDVYTESAAVTYADIDIIGRSETLKVWMSTGAREITLSFKFHAQGIVGGDAGARVGGSNLGGLGDRANQTNGAGVLGKDAIDGMTQAITKEVLDPCRFLDALRYPVIDEAGISHGPPPVMLRIGKLLSMRCVVTAYEFCPHYPVDPTTMLPLSATCNVTFVSQVAQAGGDAALNRRR